MSKFSDVLKVFEKPIGQNLDNHPSDIINVKNKLASLGRYSNQTKNGYIDAELDKSIRLYQKERNLKSDGVINPGGETEATLIGEMINPNIQTASAAAAIPWIIRGTQAAQRGKNAWDAWRALSNQQRQDEVDELEKEMQRCAKVKQLCINNCTDKVLPTGKKSDQGMDFHICLGDCLKENDCDGQKY